MPLNENDKTEFKESFDHEDFEAEVVSFLNEEGGTIYLGVAKDGTGKGVKDIDRTMIMVSDSLLDRIAPDCSELTSIHEDVVDGVKVIRVDVEKGYGLFHIKKYGHSPKGCYRRFGTRKKSMEQDEIDRRYRISIPQATIMERKSPKTKLTFSVLKILLGSAKVAYDEVSFDEDFNLRREDGAYNYMAYLLSDQFDESIKIVRFKGVGDSGDLVMRKEFGKGCIFKVFRDLLDYMDSVEHRVRTYFDKGLRRDEYLYDAGAFVEAWKNAVLHNSYHLGQFPQVYLYDDRLEIMSHGNPLLRMSKEEFLRGKSKPLNETLMKIAINVELTDQTGKGNKDIVKAYGPEAFEFSDTLLTVRIPYNPLAISDSSEAVNQSFSVEMEEDDFREIIPFLMSKGRATTVEIASETRIARRTVERRLAALKRDGRVLRIGADKNGYWTLGAIKSQQIGGVNGGVNFQNANEDLRPKGDAQKEKTARLDSKTRILSFLTKNKKGTTKEISLATGLSEKSVRRQLVSLRADGEVVHSGAKKNGRWEIIEKKRYEKPDEKL